MRHPIRLLLERGLSRPVRHSMQAFTRYADAELSILHKLTVRVVSAPAVALEDSVGWGAFWYSVKPRARPEIVLGGGLVEVVQSYDGDYERALEALIETYAHELAHYEQWRDGRKVQERGVARRAQTLVRRFHEWQSTEA